MSLAIFLLFITYTGFFLFKLTRNFSSDYNAYCSNIKNFIKDDGIILSDDLFWFCFNKGNLRSILGQAYIQRYNEKSFKEIFKEQKIKYIILNPLIENTIKKNLWGLYLTDNYLDAIKTCDFIGSVIDKHYPDYPISDHSTKIYRCNT